jgi:hypothetical protein
MILKRDKVVKVLFAVVPLCESCSFFGTEQRRSCKNDKRLKRYKTKGAMNEMRLARNEIGKNLSLTERRKSHPNGMRLKWNKMKRYAEQNKTLTE